MKSTKFWSILAMLVLVLGTTFTFFSCSKGSDDSGEENNSAVVGSWTGTDRNSYGYLSINLVFKSDGTGVGMIKEGTSSGKEVSDPLTFTYQMTAATEGILIIKEQSSSHPGGYYTHTCEFVINGKTMLLYDDDDLEWTLYKD